MSTPESRSESRKFSDFLTNLSVNPDARNAFTEDPTGFMRGWGLSNNQIIAILSQDPEQIAVELGGDVVAAKNPKIKVTVIVTVT